MTAEQKKLALVVGANKGVGFAMCQKLLAEGYEVTGTTRRPCEELKAAGATVVEGFDIATSDPETLRQALSGAQLDLLVITAGIQDRDNLEDLTPEVIRRQMEVNAIGPLFVARALRNDMKAGGQVALIASRMGSIASVAMTGGELYGYRMSKAALNMAGAALALDLKPKSVAVSIIHPGVVFTDMLRTLREARGVPPEKIRDNSIMPEASADGILKIVNRVTLDNTGEYWAADSGEHVPW